MTIQGLLIGIAAGVAAALLFLSPISGTGLAFPLFALSGLPIAIAGLGWGSLAGSIAAVAGGITVMLFAPLGGLVFVLVFGAPLAWLSHLAGLSRPADRSSSNGKVEWYPIGRILINAVGAVAAGLIIAGAILGFDPSALVPEMAAALVAFLAQASGAAVPPTIAEVEPFVHMMVSLMPVTIAALHLIVAVFNLWLGAIIARASGRFLRPRERLWTVALPGGVALAFGIAVVLAFFPGAIGDVAGVAAGALGAAMALLGLAVLHATTLGMDARGILLTATYILCFVFGLPILLLALLGLGETFLHFRARRFGGAPPTQ